MSRTFDIHTKTGRGILFATALSGATVIIFGTALTIALPAIQASLATNFTGIQWIATAYTLTLGVLILMSGAIADIFGRKRVFISGLITFAAGSLASGLIQSTSLLIVFQIITGAGAAMVVPGSLTIINTCLPKNQRGRAIGLWTGFITGGAVLAPFIGGWLVEILAWQAIFFFNVIVSSFAVLISLAFIPKDVDLRQTGLDWIGMGIISTALLGISFGLIQASPTSLIIGILLLPLFYLWERHTAHPLVPLDIFKNRLVSGANIATMLLYTALNGLIFFMILNLQQVQGFSPLYAGLAFVPAPLLITVLASPFGALADRIGPRLPMIAGPAIVAIAFGLLTQVDADSSYVIHILPGLILHGLGMAITVAPLTKSALSVKTSYSGAASGVNNAISRIAAPLAIAAFGLFVKDSLAQGFPLIMAACAALALTTSVTSWFTIRQ